MRLWNSILTLLLCLMLPLSAVSAQEDSTVPDSPKKVLTIQEPENIYQIPVEELAKSEAAKSFKDGNFEKALAEFQNLAKTYPQDITLRRYIGICYDRLGKYDEAIKAYNEALMLFPYHVPTHYYKGITFIRMGSTQKGVNELTFVEGADMEGTYGNRARVAVSEIQAGIPIIPPKTKPWNYYGRFAYVYDSNVILAPKDKALRSPAQDLSVSRYEIDGTLVYVPYQENKLKVTQEFGYSVSMNDDGQSELNFYLFRAAISVDFFTEFLGKEILNTVRQDFSIGFLDNSLFSIPNTTTVSASASLFNQTRTTVYGNFGYTQFANDGAIPRILSRDGFYEGWGTNTTFYNKAGTHWISLGYAFGAAQTRGDNFDFNANGVQASLHIPVIEKFTVDYTAAFQNAQYTDFKGQIFSRTAGREDFSWTMAAFLSRPLGKNLIWRAFYRWFDTQNDNAIFAFRRDLAGVEINLQL